MKILIYRLGSLGDTLVALPALHLIQKKFPTAQRIMLTEFSVSAKAPTVAAVLDGTGLIDQYIEYPIGLRDPGALLKLRNTIRRHRPDLLIYLAAPRGRRRAIRDSVFFHACGIHQQIGVPYGPTQQSCQRLNNGLYEYEGTRLLRCIETLGHQPLDAPDSYNLHLTDEEHHQAATILNPMGQIPLLAASIGTKADSNDWGQQNWRALIHRLGESLPNWGLVLLGAPNETDRSADLATQWPGPQLNLCGKIAVRTSAAVLSRTKIYVGHDSGPIHLSAAVGTPFIGIYSSRNLPGEWYPHAKCGRVIYHDIDCKGCRLTECIEREKACLMSISVAEVQQAILQAAFDCRNNGRD